MKRITFMLMLILPGFLNAQDKPLKSSWEIEVDPIAYILNGYSVHGIYQTGRMRFDAGVYGVEVPESFQSSKGFKLKNQGLGVKVNYLLQGIQGFYAGIGLGYSKLEATRRESGEKAEGNSIGAGVDIGYRLFLAKEKEGTRKGLYLTPWLGINYNFYPDKIKFTDREYKQKPFELFPTVHLGYRF